MKELREQADLLSVVTEGALTASVATVSLGPALLAHELYVSTPAVPDYRYRLLTVTSENPKEGPWNIDLGWESFTATRADFREQLARALQDEGVQQVIGELTALAPESTD